MLEYIKVIGAGLAGCEAAWQIASRGIRVKLFEMKPKTMSPAHKLDSFAELVCSNSLRSDQIENAVGLLKQEMRMLKSLIMECADLTRVPAGGALAVDRELFSLLVTEKIRNNPLIEIINEEVEEIDENDINAITIVASGPLTSGKVYESIQKLIGADYLHFFDASAPIVTYESLDMTKAFKASRYGKGDDDYINCPMDKNQYEKFYNQLISAETVELKDFENNKVFEGCMPVEVMASRGVDTLRFGPLKPVGITNPHTGHEPYAVVQLRQDNKDASLFNLVGFQTHLKWGEQKKVFSLIPGLENAEYLRYGVMHRNTFINSPGCLDNVYRLKKNNNIFFAGQITGVEGYVESASSGLVAGINAARAFWGQEKVEFTSQTAIGALADYVSDTSVKDFQPMNVNFGIVDKLDKRIRNKREKNFEISQRAIKAIEKIVEEKKIFGN